MKAPRNTHILMVLLFDSGSLTEKILDTIGEIPEKIILPTIKDDFRTQDFEEYFVLNIFNPRDSFSKSISRILKSKNNECFGRPPKQVGLSKKNQKLYKKNFSNRRT